MNIPRTKNNYSSITEWPFVTIVFSVFNEEKVIRRKLESLLSSDYPKDKLKILIGSDNSTDQTHQIIEEFISQNSNITLVKKETRNGLKPESQRY
jgi:cellulose synthase/poly-beta-1,6-N-acetylglucosamine synthase-like glycosyltransferase